MVLGRQGIYLLISNRGRHSESGGNTGKGAPVNPNGGANLGCEAHRQHGWYEQISKFKSASSGAVILAGTCTADPSTLPMMGGICCVFQSCQTVRS